MKTYLITYDLHKPSQNYEGLYEAIKALANGWWHHVDSTWLVNSNLSAGEIRDSIMGKLDSNDELLVISVGSNWGSSGLSDSANNWLHNNLHPEHAS